MLEGDEALLLSFAQHMIITEMGVFVAFTGRRGGPGLRLRDWKNPEGVHPLPPDGGIPEIESNLD